jgi:putative membrane protein
MRLLVWLLRAFIFFTLFAFALNNQQRVTVRWFFGAESTAPMVLVALTAFALGCAVGVVAMLPGWWRDRRAPRRAAAVGDTSPTGSSSPSSHRPMHPPQDGL